ncbi:MAG: hypothetical protein ACR2NU_09430 [Aeoliella sp.]
MSRILGAMVAIGFVFVLCQPAAEAHNVRQVVYYATPAPLIQPAPVIQSVAYVQPAAAVVYRPVLRPLTTYAAPAPQAVYYPQPVVVARPTIPVVPVMPAPVVTRRYRPILGGTVTRVWYP